MEALLDKLEGPRILVVRGLRVILDEDLARLYGAGPRAGEKKDRISGERGEWG